MQWGDIRYSGVGIYLVRVPRDILRLATGRARGVCNATRHGFSAVDEEREDTVISARCVAGLHATFTPLGTKSRMLLSGQARTETPYHDAGLVFLRSAGIHGVESNKFKRQ